MGKPIDNNTNVVDAEPTKRFFVSMLTRDISLQDAILDLIDNCIDGVIRTISTKKGNLENYSGFWAKLTITKNKFEILDNCGGISKKILTEEALRMGRLDLDRDRDLPTVGVVGIGMKRSIFKMGTDSIINTQHKDIPLKVDITNEWLRNEKTWKLELQKGRKLAENGTSILITSLYPEVSDSFDQSKSNLLVDLQSDISSLYSLVINKGFKIFINDAEIHPVELKVLAPQDYQDRNSIAPYIFKGSFEGVDILVVVGFYRKLLTTQAAKKETIEPRSKDEAGITVICNDRVVLHNDKSYQTGWGQKPVPRYHNQFISISGIVVFQSNNPADLPFNTTKRGLDVSAKVYYYALEFIKEGIKKYTDFTNQWKGSEKATYKAFDNTKLTIATRLADQIPSDMLRKVPNKSNAVFFNPKLPTPKKDSKNKRITFTKSTDDISLVAKYLDINDYSKPSEIGEACFDTILDDANSAGVLL